MTGSRLVLKLYVAGSSSKSTRAIVNAKAICDKHLKGFYDLEVIDLFQQPQRAKEDQVLAVPTLVKREPEPLRRFIGDLGNHAAIIAGLGISK
jgi:circadian clock protein KaiB